MARISEDPDFTLINAFIRTKDHNAFSGIMHKYQDQVFNYCYRFLGDEAYADDCSQEIFIRVFQNLGKFQQKAKFSSWLFRIMFNTCNEMVRSKSYKQVKRRLEKDVSQFNPAELNAHSSKQSTDPETILLRKQLNSEFQWQFM